MASQLPDHKVDTCVIGGGVVGCSIAYHLARASGGNHRVLLLEKSELTAGSTWHAAGLITFYHPGINVKRLHWDSMNLYTQLPAETGQEVGFHRCGSLRIAHDRERLDEFHFQMSRAGHLPNPQQLVSPDRVHELCPLLNMDGIIGGLYNPYDGHIDPYSLTQALATGSRRHGASLLSGAAVTGLTLREDGAWRVETPLGEVCAERVVNAAGFWAREVGHLCGLKLPLVPIHHQYVITAPLPQVQEMQQEMPVLRHLDGSYYARQERGGLLIGPYEHQDRMKISEDWMRDGVRKDFGRELFAPDLERIEPNLEKAMELLPCFQDAQIQSVVNGPITYTPDILPIIGPTMLPNMWVAAGFGYGIVHAGGTGKYLADWILNGEPPYDLIEVDPCRYSDWTTDEYSLIKCRESYGMNTALGYPREERFAGRPTSRTSGAHQLLEDRGAHMEQHTGWEQPGWFAELGTKPEYKPSFRRTNWHDRVRSECQTVMERVGVIDLTPFGKFYVSGDEARELLQWATANKVPAIGRTVVSHCLTAKGRVMAELTITQVQEDRFLVVTGGGSELHDLRWLQLLARQRQLRRVKFENVTESTGVLSVAGPNSAQLMQKLANCNGGSDDVIMPFPFLSARQLKLAGVACLALRITYTGELGWEIYHSRNETATLYKAIMEQGEELGIADFGTLTLNTMRVEKGFRAWGSEMNCDVGPLEAGLDMFLRSKHHHLGREALEETRCRGLQRILVMLSVDSDDVDPMGDETVTLNGRIVGNTTSGCYSHTTGQTLAMAYLPPYLTVPDSQVSVRLLEKECQARVLAEPPLMTYPAREAIKLKAKQASH